MMIWCAFRRVTKVCRDSVDNGDYVDDSDGDDGN